jgi:hypothetical protein
MVALIPRHPSCAACDFHGLVATICDEALAGRGDRAQCERAVLLETRWD